MALLSDAKSSAEPFRNEGKLVRVEYDFANDAGATGALSALTASASIVVRLKYMLVKTACTSGGSATLSLGKAGGTELLSTVAVAALVLDSVHLPAAPAAVELTSAEVISQSIATAALTAGKVEYVFEVMQK